MNKIQMLLFSCLSLTLSVSASAEKCVYSVDPSSVKVNWTAFKTMQKVAVNGSFPGVVISGKLKDQKSLTALLNSLKAELVVDSAKSISTGNPVREQTLFEHFFSKFKNASKISGEFNHTKVKGNEGDLDLKLSMNGKKLPVPVHFAMSEAGVFTGTGSIDVLNFALNDAFDELHRTCETLHKGPDGVSKTWSNVDLKIEAKIERSCK